MRPEPTGSRTSVSARESLGAKVLARKFWKGHFSVLLLRRLACSLINMANRPRKSKFTTNVRYTWRPEIAVTWAVVRLNEDGSETNLGAEKYKEAAVRWAGMLDRAAQEDVGKRPTKKGRLARRLPQADSSPVEFAQPVKSPDQQITFPWSLFSRRSA
jgi:hypothetical protein